MMLHSRIPLEHIDAVFEPPPEGTRKIVLSTNMAESSITIEDVEYVIDSCLTKILVADPDTNYVSLQTRWADRGSCDQRRGRAGRGGNLEVMSMCLEQMDVAVNVMGK